MKVTVTAEEKVTEPAEADQRPRSIGWIYDIVNHSFVEIIEPDFKRGSQATVFRVGQVVDIADVKDKPTRMRLNRIATLCQDLSSSVSFELSELGFYGTGKG